VPRTNDGTDGPKLTDRIRTARHSEAGIYRVSTARLQRLEAELERELREKAGDGLHRTKKAESSSHKTSPREYTARAISVMWALFWSYQAVTSLPALSALTLVTNLVVPVVLLVGSAIAGWRRPGVGGVLLIAEGVVLAVGYTVWALGGGRGLTATMLVLAALAAPPLLAGLLFAANKR
jgi:hypothetical protein